MPIKNDGVGDGNRSLCPLPPHASGQAWGLGRFPSPPLLLQAIAVSPLPFGPGPLPPTAHCFRPESGSESWSGPGPFPSSPFRLGPETFPSTPHCFGLRLLPTSPCHFGTGPEPFPSSYPLLRARATPLFFPATLGQGRDQGHSPPPHLLLQAEARAVLHLPLLLWARAWA